MKKIKKWLKDKVAIASIAFANVEKNTLGQTYEPIGSDVNHVRRHTQGQLADSLINGVVTQETKNLAWRTYKILRESDGYKTEIVGYTKAGDPITKTIKADKKRGLDKIKMDEFDSYPLEIMVVNDDITIGSHQSMGKSPIKSESDEPIKSKNEQGDDVASHGNVNSLLLDAFNKPERPIIVTRSSFPKFKLENYTKKMNVRTIDENNKLLELYISKYPDEYDRKTYMLINEIKKAISNPLSVNMLQLDEIGFTTFKTLGTEDFIKYLYKVESFDKIVEFNGHYVIKFKVSVLINGEDTLEKHKQVDLETKYENKERK